VLYRE